MQKRQEGVGTGEFLTRQNYTTKPEHRDSLVEPLSPARDGRTSTIECPITAEQSPSTRVVALGAVKLDSVPLQWLDLTSSHFCSSYHVPDKVRSRVMFATGDSPKTSTNRDLWPPRPDVSPSFSPLTPPTLPSASSLSSLLAGLSPQIHLIRSPIPLKSPLSVTAHHRVPRKSRSSSRKDSSRKESRNRSTSVPDLRRKGRRRDKGKMGRASDVKKLNTVIDKVKLGGEMQFEQDVLPEKELGRKLRPLSSERRVSCP